MTNTYDLRQLEDLSNTIPLVLDFSASYCGPCKLLDGVLEELGNEFGERVRVLAIDIEEHPDIAQHFGVRAVPTLLGFAEGEVRAQQVGFSNRRRVRELFLQLASSD